jgi:integrase
MSKRTQGNVRKLASGRFQARYTDPDGRLRTLGTFDTQKGADSALAAELTDLARGAWTDPALSGVTFAEFAADVFPTYEWKRSTREQHEATMRRSLHPAFGCLPLAKITRQKVDKWWAEEGKRGHPVARRHQYMLLSKVMRTAVDYGYLPTTPCRVPNASRDVAAPRPDFSVEDFAHVVEHLDDRMKLIIWTAFGAHLRVGELVGLQRGDYNPKTGLLRVERQVQEVRGGVQTSTTKTGKAKAVTVLEPVRSRLDSYLVKNAKLPSAPLFTLENGKPITRRYVSKHWREARAAAGIIGMRLHDIRHVSLTLVAQDATLRELMARGGHTTASAALRYQHASEERDRAVAASAGNTLVTELARLGEGSSSKSEELA